MVYVFHDNYVLVYQRAISAIWESGWWVFPTPLKNVSVRQFSMMPFLTEWTNEKCSKAPSMNSLYNLHMLIPTYLILSSCFVVKWGKVYRMILPCFTNIHGDTMG